MCAVRATPAFGADHRYEKLHLKFKNPLKRDVVFSPRLTLESGVSFEGEEQVWPGREWLKVVTFEALGLEKSYPDAESAMRAYNASGQEKVAFSFMLRDFRFERTGSRLRLVEDEGNHDTEVGLDPPHGAVGDNE